ncbi:pPIWI_RE module domain-containing protein [Streptomyces sp. NPDC091279]|uniref:pPIWI_RE module domain-containing protein n=1 Tax=Streptomyces sp. NPDC091279 TaxID=3365983 RepID=UPI0037FC9C46
MYHTIRVTAYEPDPLHGPWREELRVLRLGEDVHAELTRIHAEANGDTGRVDRLPVRQLNSLLQAMAPGVVATGRNAGTDGRLPWLYAREAVPPDVLAPLIGTWSAGLFREGDDCEGADLEESLASEDPAAALRLPEWETEAVDLTETVTSPGGTAEPAGRLYSLLPEWVAFRLAARPFRTRGTTLQFRVESSGNGARLVSWPPQRYEHRKQTWYYSACLNITVHTVPFAPQFRVHVSTQVRRWATRLDVRPYQLGGATVLLDAPLPWPEGPDRGYRLTSNTLSYDRGRKELGWRRHSPALLLPELDIVRGYPEPAELFTHPERWINGCRDVAAGIVYHPSVGPHAVGPGLMPRERADLNAWVEEGLRPVLRRVTDLKRVTRRNTPSLLPRSGTQGEPGVRDAQMALLRREALARTLNGRPLEVEVFWQSPETRAALLSELPKLIGFPAGERVGPSTDDIWQWRDDGIEIRVHARPAGPLAEALPVSRDRRRSRAVRLAEAVEGRCDIVADRMGSPLGDVGVVIAEIAGKERFAAVPDSDPKHALRIAWARLGWLSQFVNPSDDAANALEHRARWTWLDAFRQLGAISPPAHRVGAGIPGDLQYAALWLVRHTRKGPTRCPVRHLVAVRVRPGDGPDAIEGWDAERSEWLPYPQLLLLLSKTPALAAETVGPAGRHDDATPGKERRSTGYVGVRQRQQLEIERQIRALLFQLRDRPTLLLVDAANLRQCWPRLRNGSLARDMLGFGMEPDQRLTGYGNDLRMVLVRDANAREEVAEWYAHDGKEKIGFAEGVWGTSEEESRVFASTTPTPHTAAKLPKGLMKLVPTATGRTAPGKTAWNPGQLEVTVLGCLSEKALADSGREGDPPDQPAEWATLTHQLRYHDDYPPLARPLPLHLARLAGEYVLPTVQGKETHGTASDPGQPPVCADAGARTESAARSFSATGEGDAGHATSVHSDAVA